MMEMSTCAVELDSFDGELKFFNFLRVSHVQSTNAAYIKIFKLTS